jgi:ribonuclease Z
LEKLVILGCGAALPASNRNPTAQILESSGRFFLIDCGEGTQSRLRENKLSFDKITHIFISHMHGDHFLGLPGLISSMQLLGRKKKLDIYGPPDLWEVLRLQFRVSKTTINFELNFQSVESETLLFNDDKISISSLKLNHRIPCYGFIFKEKLKGRRINGPVAKEVGVPHYKMSGLRDGEDYTDSKGDFFPNNCLTLAPKKSFSYAFCSDNRIKSSLIEKLKGITHIYHEATFLDKEKARAKSTYHTTVKEACEMAKEVKPQLLILGHFSARYEHIYDLKDEAKANFENVVMAEDGKVIMFEDKL